MHYELVLVVPRSGRADASVLPEANELLWGRLLLVNAIRRVVPMSRLRPFSTSRMSANNFPFFFCSRHCPPPPPPRRRTGISFRGVDTPLPLLSTTPLPPRPPSRRRHRLRSFYRSVTIICNRAIARNRCLDIINVDIQNVRHDRNIN